MVLGVRRFGGGSGALRRATGTIDKERRCGTVACKGFGGREGLLIAEEGLLGRRQ